MGNVPIEFNAELIRKFTMALRNGQPLDPGGEWSSESVLAAMAATYFAVERDFGQTVPHEKQEIRQPVTLANKDRAISQVQLAQAIRILRNAYAENGADHTITVEVESSPKFPDDPSTLLHWST
jgi:hypothetical protein